MLKITVGDNQISYPTAGDDNNNNSNNSNKNTNGNKSNHYDSIHKVATSKVSETASQINRFAISPFSETASQIPQALINNKIPGSNVVSDITDTIKQEANGNVVIQLIRMQLNVKWMYCKV